MYYIGLRPCLAQPNDNDNIDSNSRSNKLAKLSRTSKPQHHPAKSFRILSPSEVSPGARIHLNSCMRTKGMRVCVPRSETVRLAFYRMP
ncbi:hypothetical protein M378DRAFT_769672 [Amanita muscaria Koide BX008]|uniref:Uncharacterized protein n=1 Tax=Amanita muscaria (strain Koide BX008) TaxID=946122 RepID=A0A0C2T069_AMAMK|nr:hypothetical protein M378DRAFT_769672 [Amanita muscaria Koide BX008]